MIVGQAKKEGTWKQEPPTLKNQHSQLIIIDYPPSLCGALAAVLCCGMGAGVGGPGVIAVQGKQGHANGSPRERHQSQDDPEPYSINLLALSLSQPQARIASEDGASGQGTFRMPPFGSENERTAQRKQSQQWGPSREVTHSQESFFPQASWRTLFFSALVTW